MRAIDAIKIARQEIGVKESPANSNNVKYNTWYYGHPVQDGFPTKNSKYPWCAVFISWIFKDEQSLCKKTASCVDMLSWFEKRGQIVSTPQAGDIVFFKYSTNNRRTNHVGLVESAFENTIKIKTVEGNTSISSNDNGGSVMERVRTSNIVAYARPNYTDNVKKSVDEVAKEIAFQNDFGGWGTGAVRRQRLKQAGYDYKEVQSKVNQLLK